MSISMIKRLLACLLTCALAVIFSAGALADSSATAYTRGEAKVYDDAGKVLGTLPANTKLTVTGVKGDVCRVERDGRTAYVMKSDLVANAGSAEEPVKPQTPQPERRATAYVSRDGAKVYGADGSVEGTLSLNTKLTVTGVKDGVCQVERDGRTAYMRKADLSASPVAAPEAPAQPQSSESVTAYVSRDGAKVYNAKGEAAGTLGLNTRVTVTGVKGEACRIVSGGKTGYMRKADLSAEKVKAEPAPESPASDNGLKPARGSAVEKDWWTSDIQTIFARGVVAQITDVQTGLTWREKRFGGNNHADCQPLTAADTAVMKRVYGGSWSWNRRAVFVTINGVNYAASINGMPHGDGSISDNNFDGHHCIHFTNSRTHGSNKVDAQHQAAIKKAASARL